MTKDLGSVSPLVRKLLENGVIDRHVAQMMERWGGLQRGAHELTPEEGVIRKATQEGLVSLAEEIEELLVPLERGKETTVFG